jgi:hypothetical protein
VESLKNFLTSAAQAAAFMDAAEVSLAMSGLVGFTEPRLRLLYEYWLERKGERRFPARRDIDPLEFSYLLGSVVLVDVLRHPLRFRVRVHGTEMARRARYDLTGKLLDQLPIMDYRDYVLERCTRLVESGEPALVHHDRVIDGQRRRYEALWLPLSADGIEVTMLLGALIYQDRTW